MNQDMEYIFCAISNYNEQKRAEAAPKDVNLIGALPQREDVSCGRIGLEPISREKEPLIVR
jgi:hypothetical protein